MYGEENPLNNVLWEVQYNTQHKKMYLKHCIKQRLWGLFVDYRIMQVYSQHPSPSKSELLCGRWGGWEEKV